jgi:hypothetical protein
MRAAALQRFVRDLVVDENFARTAGKAPHRAVHRASYLNDAERNALLDANPGLIRALADAASRYAEAARSLPNVGRGLPSSHGVFGPYVKGDGVPASLDDIGGLGAPGIGDFTGGYLGAGSHAGAGDPRGAYGGGAGPSGPPGGGNPLGAFWEQWGPGRRSFNPGTGYTPGSRGALPPGYRRQGGPADLASIEQRLGLAHGPFGSGAQLPNGAWKTIHPGEEISDGPSSQEELESKQSTRAAEREGAERGAKLGMGAGIVIGAMEGGLWGAAIGSVAGTLIGHFAGGAYGRWWGEHHRPSDDSTGPGGPRSVTYRPSDESTGPSGPRATGSPEITRELMPAPDDTGYGGGPKGRLFRPNPEDGLPGTPRSRAALGRAR